MMKAFVHLVRTCGGALTATSANPSGQAPARSATEVAGYFPDGLDLILDGGEVETDQPSTVVDLTGAKARLVREGAIRKEDLRIFCSSHEGRKRGLARPSIICHFKFIICHLRNPGLELFAD